MLSYCLGTSYLAPRDAWRMAVAMSLPAGECSDPLGGERELQLNGPRGSAGERVRRTSKRCVNLGSAGV